MNMKTIAKNTAPQKHIKSSFKVVLGILFLISTAAAIHYLWIIAETTSVREIKAAFSSLSTVRFIIAFMLVILNYWIITGYDALGLWFAGSKLRYKRIGPIAFIGDTINANTPFSAIVGSIIKLRLYMKSGESPLIIAKAIASYTFAYWAGFSAIYSISGIISCIVDRNNYFHVSGSQHIILTLITGTLFIAYLVFCLRLFPPSLKVKLSGIFPSGFAGLKLLSIGIADWLLSTLIFFVLTPSAGDLLKLPQFIHAYLIAHSLGIASQLPGGIGVFESTCLIMNDSISHATLIASLLSFRLLFFVLPLVISLPLLGIGEFLMFNRNRRRRAGKTGDGQKLLPLVKHSEYLPTVSIVVPAFNEEVALPRCLEALTRQDYKGQFTITVVNNASTDATAEIARAFGCNVIYESQKGYNHAIKRGYDCADGDIIASTDADTIVNSNWISNIVAIMSAPEVVACGGVFNFHDGPPLLKLIGAVFGKVSYHIAGANMAVRKEAYCRCGGFSIDINLSADVDIHLRLKKIGTVVIDHSLVVATSSRRFACAFWKTLVMYFVNDACLIFLKRPIFHSFPDFRSLNPIRSSGLVLSSIMALFFILFTGWILELPYNQILGTVHAKGPRVNAIALTFDDGPGKTTDTILDILKEHATVATFFVIGKNANNHSDILQRAVREGHEIGNHSYTHHLKIAIESPETLRKELDTTDSIIRNATGKKPTLFRPPRGWRNPWMIKFCRTSGYETVLWTIDSQDWQHATPLHIRHNVLSQIHPGSIILMHDRLNTGTDKSMTNTVAALPGIIDALSDAGFTFVTVSELLSLRDAKDPFASPLSSSTNILQLLHSK
jgi:peptidoglycan-N-acetylglucosamine deacetylase